VIDVPVEHVRTQVRAQTRSWLSAATASMPRCIQYHSWTDADQLGARIMADGIHEQGTRSRSSRRLRGLKHSAPTVLATRSHQFRH
jgi:hypothetical protein